MLSTEAPANLTLRAPNDFGGHTYLSWYWSFLRDTLRITTDSNDGTKKIKYKFIHIEDSIICKY